MTNYQTCTNTSVNNKWIKIWSIKVMIWRTKKQARIKKLSNIAGSDYSAMSAVLLRG